MLSAGGAAAGGAWSAEWDTPSQYAGAVYAREANSAAVERCQAAGGFSWAIKTNFYWCSLVHRQRAKLLNVKDNIKQSFPKFLKRDSAGEGGVFTGLTDENIPGLFFADEYDFLDYCGLPSNWFASTPWLRLNHPSVTNGWIGTKVALEKLVSTYRRFGPAAWTDYDGDLGHERNGYSTYTGVTTTAWVDQVAKWNTNEWSYGVVAGPPYYVIVDTDNHGTEWYFTASRKNCLYMEFGGEMWDDRPSLTSIPTNYEHTADAYFRFASRGGYLTCFDFDDLVGGGGAIDTNSYYHLEQWGAAATNERVCTVLPAGEYGGNPFQIVFPTAEDCQEGVALDIYLAGLLWVVNWDLPGTNGFRYW